MSAAHPAIPPESARLPTVARDLREVRQTQAAEILAHWLARDKVMASNGKQDRTSLEAPQANDTAVASRHGDRERKLIYGQLFRTRILQEIFTRCEKRAEVDRQKALARAGGDEHLLNGMLRVLREARLTINFNPVQIEQSSSARIGDEVVNCFAFREKPGAPRGSNAGRAHMEEYVLGLGELLRGKQPYAEFGRYDSAGFGAGPARDFQWTSRPCYAALDFLHGPNGGAPTYGHSFLVLHDHFKHVCSYCPVDTFALRLGHANVRPNELSTFFHLETLIARCQDDPLGYSCLKSLKAKACGKDMPVHRNYGYGGRNNYIDAQVYARIVLHRDVKEIHFASKDLLQMPAQQRQILERTRTDLNNRLGREFVFIDG
jgi:hypothetical protein